MVHSLLPKLKLIFTFDISGELGGEGGFKGMFPMLHLKVLVLIGGGMDCKM